MSTFDTVLFTAGSVPVTLGLATIAGALLVAVLIVFMLVNSTRASAEQALNAAQQATENLRQNFQEQIAGRDLRIRDLDLALDREREKSSDFQAELAAMRTRLDEQAQQNAANLKRFFEAREQMTNEFKSIAGDVLKSHGETFSKQNREQVDILLKPLHEKIVEFQGGMVRDRATMGEQIRALAESNITITTEAQNLTRALKGSSQTQGAWGEMILSTILERSGLREGEQYLTQTSHSGEDGARLRTDVEILMPNSDRLVIDSKVSLTAFEAYTNAEENVREQYLQAHIVSIRSHIRTLGEKNYHRHARSSLDYVMMFVPIEGALAAAMKADTNLFEYGMGQGVMLTTPSTLMTVLRTVRNVWDIEKRHRNAEEIAERAGALYEKVAGFLSTMDRVGDNLDKAQQSFSKAKEQLSSGRGNVVRQVEMLRELGAKSSKALPTGWDGGSEDAPSLRLAGDEPPEVS